MAGAPFVVDAPDKVGTLTQFARAAGAKAVAIEMGGRSRDELMWAERIALGLRRIVTHVGAFAAASADAAPTAPRPVGPSTVLRPPIGGVFEPIVREEAVGTTVPQGTELGRLLDFGTLAPIHTFTAPFPETALMLLRPHVGVLEGGAMTYVVARPGGDA